MSEPERPATFESKLARIEQIVKELESGRVELDRQLALFKEGKRLEAECAALLKSAQAELERASATTPVGEPDGDRDDESPF